MIRLSCTALALTETELKVMAALAILGLSRRPKGGSSWPAAAGTLPVKNTAGEVTAEELHRATLCAPQMMISVVLDTESWLEWL